MARRAPKPLPSLHIPLADLPSLSASDLLAIIGPKFITSDSEAGCRTYAVLISHKTWKRLNHGVPDVNPHQIVEYFVDGQAYLIVPIERSDAGPTIWQTPKESIVQIITRRNTRKRAVA